MANSTDNKIKENIQKNIAFYRKRAKLTQKDLADRLGTGATTVSGWERGAATPDVEILFQICNVLSVSVSDIFGMDTTNNSFEISAEEKVFLNTYRKLNNDGKAKLQERAEELVTLGFVSTVKGENAKMA